MKQLCAVMLLLFFIIVSSHAQQTVLHPSGIKYEVTHDVSLPLREMQILEPGIQKKRWEETGIPNKFFQYDWNELNKPVGKNNEKDPVLQKQMGLLGPIHTILNFDGIGGKGTIVPPDANGDVGLNYYIQAVNVMFAVYAKTGALLYGPANIRTLWEGFPPPTVCDGDPIVLYDHLANRWLISNFSLPNYPNGPYYMLIAVSQSEDPLGSWNRYSFKFSDMPDYPKLGVWPDGYYLTANSFTPGAFKWKGPLTAVLERDAMLTGSSARMVFFQQDSALTSMLPADLDGPAPPAGTPGYFLMAADDALGYDSDQLQLFQLHADWADTANFTFTGPQIINAAAFDLNMCGNISSGCIPQKNTSRKLDALSLHLMQRLQFRDFGSHQSMLINHTVDAENNDHAGVRWYEVRKSSSDWTIYQQGTYAPDARHRWMGSTAMDGNGNIALGYSVSCDTAFPSIGITGRRVGDAPNQMNCIEEIIMAGMGSQTGDSRWGDYTSMTVDPSDDETFWYTNQYYAITSSMKWNTRIASFKISDLQVSVKERPFDSPKNNMLYKNFPNPFSQITMFRWILREPGKVNIQVFDVTGKCIVTLADTEQNAGEHEVEFDASGLPAGVYICRFTTGQTIETQKLLLMK